MSGDRYIEKLKMPRSALAALVKAVPDQVVKEIVADASSSRCLAARLPRGRYLVGRQQDRGQEHSS